MEISQALSGPISQKGQAHFLSNDPFQGLDKNDPKIIGGKFESIFYRMILKQIRESKLNEGLFNSHAMETRAQMRDDELAEILGNAGHLGITKMIEDFTAKMNGENIIHPHQFKQGLSLPKGLIKEVQS